MSDALYLADIKELARSAHGAGRLARPSVSAYLDNPLCGDRITLDLRLQGGAIAEIAHETRGCLLCQAAAALLALKAPGCTPVELAGARVALEALMTGAAPPVGEPVAHWPELDAFAPVHAHKSRHGCVLLPWRALEQALAGAHGQPDAN